MTALAYVYGCAALGLGLLIVGWALYEMEYPEDHGRVSKGWRREHGGGR